MSQNQQPELQQRTLRLYGELLCRRDDWGGQLAVAAFTGAASSGLAAAASLAGAASLTVDDDTASMKSHFRDGAFDFVVNTLDESFRALKNEIRKRRPIAIGLIADPHAALAESVARGLAARIVVMSMSEPTTLEKDIAGAEDSFLGCSGQSLRYTEWLNDKRWIVGTIEEPPSLTQLDEGDPRQRWLRNLPAHQRSVTRIPRWSWVTHST